MYIYIHFVQCHSNENIYLYIYSVTRTKQRSHIFYIFSVSSTGSTRKALFGQNNGIKDFEVSFREQFTCITMKTYVVVHCIIWLNLCYTARCSNKCFVVSIFFSISFPFFFSYVGLFVHSFVAKV